MRILASEREVPRTFQQRWIWLFGGVITAAAAVALYLFDPASGGWLYPPCPFRGLTGWLCPGCGTLRAMHQLLHGNLAAAMKLNMLAVISVPFAVFVRVVRIRQIRRGRLATGPERMGQKWIWAGVGILLLFGVGRNLF